MSGDTADARNDLARDAVRALYDRDRASQMLGMIIESAAPGAARVTMRVRADMLNGHGICHGGLLFALADSAFAFACNSHGHRELAAAATIDFLAPAHEGDQLAAIASERWRGGRGGLYDIEVRNQRGDRVAVFHGRSHRTAARQSDE